MGILEDPAKDDLLAALKAGKRDGDLFLMLDRLSRDALRVLAGRPSNAGELRLLAGYVSEIRHLLSELSHQCGTGSPREHCRDLADRYLELEGLVKELRNDLGASDRNGGEKRT